MATSPYSNLFNLQNSIRGGMGSYGGSGLGGTHPVGGGPVGAPVGFGGSAPPVTRVIGPGQAPPGGLVYADQQRWPTAYPGGNYGGIPVNSPTLPNTGMQGYPQQQGMPGTATPIQSGFGGIHVAPPAYPVGGQGFSPYGGMGIPAQPVGGSPFGGLQGMNNLMMMRRLMGGY